MGEAKPEEQGTPDGSTGALDEAPNVAPRSPGGTLAGETNTPEAPKTACEQPEAKENMGMPTTIAMSNTLTALEASKEESQATETDEAAETIGKKDKKNKKEKK